MTIREDWSLYVWFDGPDYQGLNLSLYAGDDATSIYAQSYEGLAPDRTRVGGMASGPHEGTGPYWYETGLWTFSEIPEPSIAALSLLGLAFIAKKRKA